MIASTLSHTAKLATWQRRFSPYLRCDGAEKVGSETYDAKLLQRSNLVEEETGDDEDQRADNVAELELGHDGNVLSKLNGHLTEQQQQGKSLQEVDAMTSGCSPAKTLEMMIVTNTCGALTKF